MFLLFPVCSFILQGTPWEPHEALKRLRGWELGVCAGMWAASWKVRRGLRCAFRIFTGGSRFGEDMNYFTWFYRPVGMKPKLTLHLLGTAGAWNAKAGFSDAKVPAPKPAALGGLVLKRTASANTKEDPTDRVVGAVYDKQIK